MSLDCRFSISAAPRASSGIRYDLSNRARLTNREDAMSVRHLYVGAVAAIMGCASASNTSNMQDLSGKPRTSTILTAEEIGAAHADNATAYDALARLRPNWLAAHGGMS